MSETEDSPEGETDAPLGPLVEEYWTKFGQAANARSLPDARDGLKPVHRRVLEIVAELAPGPNRTVKSARIVGDVLGRRHPHGDVSVYDAACRMTRDYINHVCLVRGQGNFGGINGSRAAAMRYCLTGDTLLETLNGALTPIGSVLEAPARGEFDVSTPVRKADGTAGRATKYFNCGSHPATRVRLKNGMDVTGSSNHPLAVVEDGQLAWKLLSEIGAGDKVAVDCRKRWGALFRPPPNKGTLFGALASEGYASGEAQHYYRVGFSNSSMEYLEIVEELLKKEMSSLGLEPEVCRNKARSTNKPVETVEVYGERFRTHVVGNLRGSVSADKRVPYFVLAGGPEIKVGFLSAMFEGDGHVSLMRQPTKKLPNLEVGLSSKSRPMLAEVQLLLLQFGILSSVRPESQIWRLTISGLENLRNFQASVNFLCEKREKLKEHLALFDGMPSRCRGRLPRLDGIAAIAVKEIENLGELPVYSLRVDSPCHSFVAGGVINHNTEMELGADSRWLALDGIAEGAVPMVPNYSEDEVEPALLPVKVPLLLLNGAPDGSIGVGYASAIPPHNPSELAAAVAVLVRAYAEPAEGDDEESVLQRMMESMPGPDFPTGGIVGDPAAIEEMYRTGKGAMKVRCEATVEPDRNRIVVTAMPYGENSEEVTTDIGEAIRGRVDPKTKRRAEPQVPEARSVRDETTVDRTTRKSKVRIVVELKQGEDGPTVLEKLYKHTRLQTSFSANMTALDADGKPRLFGLVELIQAWLAFRMDCVKLAAGGRLREAALRHHVAEGLLAALSDIDRVVETIRASEDDPEIVRGLMELLGASTKQAETISAMQLKRLARTKVAALEKEVVALEAEMSALIGLISDPARVYEQILGELEEFARRFPAARRTRIAVLDSKDARALVAPEEGLLTITGRGYLRRVPASEFRAQHRGGKGKQGAKIKAEDALRAVVRCNSHDRVFPISNLGRVVRLEAHEVPTGGGGKFAAALGFEDGEVIAAVLTAPWPLPENDEVVIASLSGMVKRVALADLSGRNNVAMNLYRPAEEEPGTVVGAALFPGGQGHVFLASSAGLGTRFSVADVRMTKRGSGGVIGIDLPGGVALVSMSRLMPEDDDGEFIMCVASDGYGKRVPKDQFPTQNRAGKGRILIKMHPGAHLVAALVLSREDTVLVATRRGMTGRFRASDIRELGRSAVGSRVMALADDDAVVAAAIMPPDDE